jgi:hypothetical protein
MKIAETYSHLNGLKFLIVHEPNLWQEIQTVIAGIDAEKCRTKVSKEKTMKGKRLYSPIDMNAEFKRLLRKKSWNESRVSYWVTKSEKLIRKTLTMPAKEQKQEIEMAGEVPIFRNENEITYRFESRFILSDYLAKRQEYSSMPIFSRLVRQETRLSKTGNLFNSRSLAITRLTL